MSSLMNSTDGLFAVETFVQCAPGCQRIEVLLRRFMDAIKATKLVDQILIILVNPDDPESHQWVATGLEQSELDDLLIAMEARLIRGTCADVLIDMLSWNSKSIYIESDGDHGNSIGFFATCPDGSDSNVQYVERVARLLLSILNLSAAQMNAPASKLYRLQEIINAKLQWEMTVDNLPDLVCLLDENGLVVRANKTLETWGLGNVKLVKGMSVHDMLHPGCSDKQCSLRINWQDMWNASAKSGSQVCEFFDHFGQRDFRLSLRCIKCDISTETGMEKFFIFVAQDVSDSKHEDRLVEDYNEELYRKLNCQTGELYKVSTDLKWEKASHKQVKKVLKKSESTCRSLSAQLLTAQEEERKRIAGELHDGIGQSISAIKFGLEHMLITGEMSNPQMDVASIQATVGRLQAASEEIRRISMGLRPSMLDDLGLAATLRWLCKEFESLHQNIALDRILDVDEERLTEIQVDMIFRIIQEALNNISKHSRAESASIWLTSGQKRLILEIKDDGVGFDWKAGLDGKGFGLSSMRERARISDGFFSIESREGEGTLLRVVWPQPGDA